MAGLLADVFSFGDTAKRKVKGLLADPVGTLQQFVGNENDRAGRLNELTNSAAQEMATRIKSGGSGMGASEQRLAGLLADAYNPAGMVVWHGSPHKFAKFDSSKIGTGEGAQAYGHGLYLAESPDVAKSYLATGQAVKAQDRPTEMVARAIDAAGGDDVAAKAWLQKRLSTSLPEFRDIYESALSGFDKLKPQGSSLYKVDLPDEHIAKMLDWDAPLSKQPKEVQAALKKTRSMLPPNAMDDLGGDMNLLYNPANTGADFLGTMNSLQPNLGETALRNAGIPGIRYLDGGSRGTGQGTSNFVVFPGNENLLQILERNGKPLNGLLD